MGSKDNTITEWLFNFCLIGRKEKTLRQISGAMFSSLLLLTFAEKFYKLIYNNSQCWYQSFSNCPINNKSKILVDKNQPKFDCNNGRVNLSLRLNYKVYWMLIFIVMLLGCILCELLTGYPLLPGEDEGMKYFWLLWFEIFLSLLLFQVISCRVLLSF